ncbi:MAG: iron ABC transporter permease, partial [Pseudomonadota bacterium]
MMAQNGSASARRGAWTAAALAIAAITALPVVVALGALFVPADDAFRHIVDHVLWRVVGNTLGLVVAVGFLTAVLGVALAGLTTYCEFPGRRFFDWALMLPLAVPGYVLAFCLGGLVDFQGPLRAALAALGLQFARWPQTNGAVASVICLTLALYPYVYLLARQAFRTAGSNGLEVAQTLGCGRLAAFWRVAVPAARPWIVGGSSLVVMETLADFGTVKIFNFDTLTTAIYSAWYGLFSLAAALQLSLVLIAFVVVALLLERRARGRARYSFARSRGVRHRMPLAGPARFAASAFAAAVFVTAFAAPVGLMLHYSLGTAAAELGSEYIGFALRSLTLGFSAAGVIVLLAVVLGYAGRRAPGRTVAAAQRFATLGYALPGTVLAVGFFVPVAWLSRGLNELGTRLGGGDAGIVLTGTLLTLLLAYAARFMAVAYQPLDAGFGRITPTIEEAAGGLGARGLALLGRVHLPILTPAVASAALLVFMAVAYQPLDAGFGRITPT